jgi:hypothetical protein
VTKAFRASLYAHLIGAAVGLAGPAAAEVPYLMYLKGSEGPPNAPIRVLWNVLDDANARITIDLGEKHEPALSKLGLGRVLKYDAKLDKARFIVRAPELTHLVKTISTSIVQSLLQASPLAGAWAQKPDAAVERAELHITPDRRPARLEVTTWLHVTYLAPQKSGRAKMQDLIKGDLIFVGQPEAPDATPQPSKP